jgi:hypothetical protein
MSDKAQYPIIYVRGYAGSQGEVEDTVATPYMGFNLGSTKLRQAYTGDIVANVFESPLIRLMKDYGYVDAYRDGQIRPQSAIDHKSIWIYRYYDVVSEDLGSGNRKEIEFHAAELRKLILHVEKATQESWPDDEPFRVHLAAHSMGGLVCRAYLQHSAIPGLDGNPAQSWEDKGVDKLFTFATPHKGIEFRDGLGWIEGLRDFLDVNNAGNFGPERMQEFLDLSDGESLNSLDGKFPAERVFCMVGTDSKDYSAAWGLSRRSVGPLSDGLVTIANASVSNAARAFVHRSHSGHYGIVNSESSYQNLARFLFGNVRVEGRLYIEELSLPRKVQKALENNVKVRASYHFESILRVRGARWDLSRRLVEEGSAVFHKFDDMFDGAAPRPIHIFTGFLSTSQRKNKRRKSLGFSLDLAAMVPDYEVDGFLWFDDHYEGGYLFRDKYNFEATPPNKDQSWKLRYGLDSDSPNAATKSIGGVERNGAIVFTIPIDSKTRPGMKAAIELTCAPWNED